MANSKLQRKVLVFQGPVALARKGAELFLTLCSEAVAQKGYFVVGLSGGRTPRQMHQLLARDPYLSQIPWSQVHFFWVDERIVPYDSDASNYGTARSDLLRRVPVPPENLHPVLVDRDAEQCAMIYEKQILQFFGLAMPQRPSFDLLLLGMGEDGHTASLLPGQEERWKSDRLAVSVKGGTPDLERVTMTPSLINASRTVAFFVSGGNKSAALRDVLTNPQSELPAAQILPQKGRLLWLLDIEAAAILASSNVTPILTMIKETDKLQWEELD